jgi:hypothetical protein
MRVFRITSVILRNKHVRGDSVKSESFLRWGKLWKGISSKEYRHQSRSKIQLWKHGFFKRKKLWTRRFSIKLSLAAGSLLFSQRDERIKLFERTIYPLKREKLYSANLKNVGVWKKTPRFQSRQSVKLVTKPRRRNKFGMRQILNIQKPCWNQNVVGTKTSEK